MSFESNMRLYLSRVPREHLLSMYAHHMQAYASNKKPDDQKQIRNLLREELDARQISRLVYEQEALVARAVAQCNEFINYVSATTPRVFRSNRI